MKIQKFKKLTLESYVWIDKLEFLAVLEKLIEINTTGYELEGAIGEFLQIAETYVKEVDRKEIFHPKRPIRIYDYIYLPKILEFCADLGENQILEVEEKNQIDEIFRIIERNRVIAECRLKFIKQRMKREDKRKI